MPRTKTLLQTVYTFEEMDKATQRNVIMRNLEINTEGTGWEKGIINQAEKNGIRLINAAIPNFVKIKWIWSFKDVVDNFKKVLGDQSLHKTKWVFDEDCFREDLKDLYRQQLLNERWRLQHYTAVAYTLLNDVVTEYLADGTVVSTSTKVK